MLHYPVLLSESIELLQIKLNGIYVDGTFGRGGHTQAILNKLGPEGKLIAFDKDIEAIKYGNNLISDLRFNLVHESFANIDKYLEQNGLNQVDGILLDLGVSSPQIDDPKRGFSFRFDSVLDMRMDNTSGITAWEWLAKVTEVELSEVLWKYGEERYSRKIASNIIKARQAEPIKTTKQLAEIIARSFSSTEKGQHPATRSFQAIRIFINNELSDLEVFLSKITTLLTIGGRVVIVSFHSLEDRLVKTVFNKLATADKLPKWVDAQDKLPNYKVIAKKIKASNHEIFENTRSRSAIMRSIERIS